MLRTRNGNSPAPTRCVVSPTSCTQANPISMRAARSFQPQESHALASTKKNRPSRNHSALYTSDSDTDTSQKSKFNNSNYLLRICRSSAPAFRATPATMQFIIHNDAKLSKLMPAQPLTANGSGGFSSRETHRTQPASRDTTPRVRGLAADPNEAVG